VFHALSNVTDQTLTGHAAVVLLDEGDFRLKRANSSNRVISAESAVSAPHPFDTLACAWSATQQSAMQLLLAIEFRFRLLRFQLIAFLLPRIVSSASPSATQHIRRGALHVSRRERAGHGSFDA